MEDPREKLLAGQQSTLDERIKAMMEMSNEKIQRLKSLEERVNKISQAKFGPGGSLLPTSVAPHGLQARDLKPKPWTKKDFLRSLRRGEIRESVTHWQEKLEKQHSTFMGLVHSALTVAFFTSLFSFVIFSSHVRYAVFGHEDKSDGILPYVWVGSWPTVVITLIITVTPSCGSSLRLTYQNVAGTLMAMINICVLMLFFPEGAKGPSMKKPYSEWICWVDTLGVTFLYLISSIETNTLKIGLSNHLSLMMGFMNPSIGASIGNPEWYYLDSPLWTSLVVTTLGSLIAVAVTYFPHPHMNLTKLDDGVKHLAEQFGHTWALAIKYMAGEEKTTAGQQVGTKVKSVQAVVPKLSDDLSASWWECFTSRHCSTKRAFYESFVDYFQHLNHVMNAVASTCADEDFKGARILNTGLGQSMKKTRGAIQKLLVKSCEYCADCDMSESEKQSIQESKEAVNDCLKQLGTDYNYAMSALGSSSVSEEVANESVFLFLLVIWGRKTIQFCEESFLKGPVKVQEGVDVVGYVKETCNPHFEDHDHIMFAIRNFVSISIMYVVGYNVNSGVFTGYDATAAVALCWLANKNRGAAFMSSVTRLLGIALGKTLPMILLMLLNKFDCGNPTRTPIHCIVVFCFVFAFIYVSKTTSKWAGAAGAIAVFGTGTLVQACSAASSLLNNQEARNKTYTAAYSNIGVTICAVVVQMAVDAFFSEKAARDMALDDVEKITNDLGIACTSMFDGKSEKLQGDLRKLTADLANADGLAEETDPKFQVAPGVRSPFRKDLYINVLHKWRLLLGDYYILQETLSGPDEAEDPGRLLNILKGCDAWNRVSGNFRETIKNSSGLVKMVLKHDTDGNIEGLEDHQKELQNMHGFRKLDGVEDLWQQLKTMAEQGMLKTSNQLFNDDRIRLSVFLQSMRNANKKLGEIILLCFSEDIFGEDAGDD